MAKKTKIKKSKILLILALIFGWGAGFFFKVYAGNSDYQRCEAGGNCIIGEFLYDDNYLPIATASCTLTSRNPSGEIFLNAVPMTAASDGWYSYTFNTTGEAEGLYRSQMCCSAGSDYLCLDKSFYIGPSYLSTADVAGAVWEAKPTAYQTADTFGANLQNPVLTASQIWGYSSRTLSNFGTLIADIWNYSTRSLTTFGNLAADIWNNAARTLTGASLSEGQLATKTNVDEATASAVLSIKADNSYDLGDIIGYVDTLETSVGTATDTASAATVFGKIKGVKDAVDKLSLIDADIDNLVSKWGAYDAEDIYDKVKNLSSEISAVNVVSNVSSVLSLVQTDVADMTDLKNKVAAMKAVVEVNRTLLEKVSNQPVIKTWIEEGSIIFKTLITNPSEVASQKVPLKYYLPKELTKEDIIKLDEDLKIDYDAVQEAYYVFGEFELEPGGTKILSVETEDIWKISEEEINSLRKQTEELAKPLEKTSYFAQGNLLKADINLSLEKILRLQKEAVTPQARIRAYRDAQEELKAVNAKIDTLKTLVASAGSVGTMFGFIGGVQTLGVWGMIIILVAGFVFLALYLRQISFSVKTKKGEVKEQEAANLSSENLKRAKKSKRTGILAIAILSFGLTCFGAGLWFKIKNANSLPEPTPVLTPTPTPTITTAPNQESQEIEVKEEKQVLGEKSQKYLLVVYPEQSVNIRKEPSLTAEIMGKISETREVMVLEEKDDWARIYPQGWISRQFLVPLP